MTEGLDLVNPGLSSEGHSEDLKRSEAVKQLAGHVADLDRFVMAMALEEFGAIAADFAANISTWTAYIDSGGDAVLRTDDAQLVEMYALMFTGSVVVTVSKSVPAARLRRVLGRSQLPVDGQRSYLDMESAHHPALFYAALEAVDPVATAGILARIPFRPEVPGIYDQPLPSCGSDTPPSNEEVTP